MSYTYPYPRPMVSVDIIIVNEMQGKFGVLLIKRLNDPFKNNWALPGGFVDEHEGLLSAAKRELLEETDLKDLELEQFASYGDPGRDPRGHSVSIVYFTVLKNALLKPKAGDDAKETGWFEIEDLPKLAFDHAEIIKDFIGKHIKKRSTVG